MSRESLLKRIVDAAGLGDLWIAARRGARIARSDLERVRTCGHPLAAAALADARREQAAGVVVTHPWTLRVRAPSIPFVAESAMFVSHPIDRLAGVPATETQLVGALPSDLPLGLALEMIRSVKSARPDVPLRAFSPSQVEELSITDGASLGDVVTELARVGLDTLDWAPGDGTDGAALRVHEHAHDARMKTVAPVGYSKGGVDEAFLGRLDAIRELDENGGGFLSAVVLPDRTEGASPLHGPAGTEDTLACALTRLALGHTISHVTIDAHVIGHKLAALLLSAGADDVVGAQAAAAWTTPTGDGPRPLNPDRMRRYVIEARRSPDLRDGLFRDATASTG